MANVKYTALELDVLERNRYRNMYLNRFIVSI